MNIEQCPVIQPSWKQFNDFHSFVQKLQKTYSHTYGIVKIVPPQGWKPNNGDYQNFDNMMINGPIQQNAYGKGGIYQCMHIQKKSMTVREYKKKIECFENITAGRTHEQIENLFWKNLSFSPPLYGADLKLSFMDEKAGAWNLNNLNSVLSNSLHQPIPGVNTSYCYIGSWKSLFCWHTEDIELSAINYLHFGKSKYWYGIGRDDREVLENQAKKLFHQNFANCQDYLRHKTSIINPYLLKSKHKDLKISKIVQNPGEFILAFGGAYHCGFNSGFNMAEAVNYATYSWLEALKFAKSCKCRKDSVQMSQYEIANTLMKSSLKSNINVIKFYNDLNPTSKALKSTRIRKVNLVAKKEKIKKLNRSLRSISKPSLKQKDIKATLKTKLIKKRGKSSVMVKGQNLKIEEWAQCHGCKKWRRVGKMRINKRLPFRCETVGKSCKGREQRGAKYISLSV